MNMTQPRSKPTHRMDHFKEIGRMSTPLRRSILLAFEVCRRASKLLPHPHDPDIQTVLRVCNVHNVPTAGPTTMPRS